MGANKSNIHFLSKTVRTKYGDYMKFGTFLDVNGNFFDIVHLKIPKSLPASGYRSLLIRREGGAGFWLSRCRGTEVGEEAVVL